MAICFRGVGVITFTTRDRMVRHGWLTPAAPSVRRRFAEKWRHSRCTNTRFPRAAGASPPWFGNVTSLRTGNADRQPHTYVRLGAAGVTPPGYGNVSRLQSAAKNVRRTPTAESGAAGVSPPWYGNVTFLRTGNADRQPHPYVQLGAATVSPPWVGNPSRVQSGESNFRPTTPAASRSANRRPAVVRKPHLQRRSVFAE
jgi:hypothetical protein